jgi:WD40 repeat protein
LAGHNTRISSLAELPNGNLASSAGHEIRIWNTNTGNLLFVLEGTSFNLVEKLEVLPNDNLAASDSKGFINIWHFSYV